MKGRLLNMRLFDESENKYYELISYFVSGKKSFTDKDIQKHMMRINANEIDIAVYEALFSKEEGLGSIFCYEDSAFRYVLDDAFPVRLNQVEQQALFSVVEYAYAAGFIKKQTIDRIEALAHGRRDWVLSDIKIKSQDVRDKTDDLCEKIAIIVDAIRDSRELLYDNVREGKYSYQRCVAWPVKLEYSFTNDVFRLCTYIPEEGRFIKISLHTLRNLSLGKRFKKDLEEEYTKFMKENTKQIILEVDPVSHVIERCFRLFSFYDRKAIYDSEKEKYLLELNYYKFDESEILRDIMSLGSSVVVLEPRGIQIKIYNRLVAARKNYLV